jgi:uncharacterized Tic20 family protein
MEYIQKPVERDIYPYEYESASNSYLMCVVSVIAGLPLPIINVIASVGYYMAQRKSSYFVRWHCIQAILAQAIMVPFNSVAFGWTLGIIINDRQPTLFYGIYLFIIILLNIVEFVTVIITAIRVRNGHNMRWAVIADLTDSLYSKEERDPFRI